MYFNSLQFQRNAVATTLTKSPFFNICTTIFFWACTGHLPCNLSGLTSQPACPGLIKTTKNSSRHDVGCEVGITGNNRLIFLKDGQDGKRSKLHNRSVRNDAGLKVRLYCDSFFICSGFKFSGKPGMPENYVGRNSDDASCDSASRGIIPSKKISLGSSVPKSFATVSAVQIFLCIHSMPVLQPIDIF